MPSINGDQPELDGDILQGMICTQHWTDGTLEDAANVIYYRIHDCWHRLYFDFGTVFWRTDVDAVPEYPGVASPDEPFVNVDLGTQLSIIGRTITSCTTEPVGEYDSEVTFHFDGGGTLSFTCVGDITTVEHCGLLNRGT